MPPPPYQGARSEEAVPAMQALPELFDSHPFVGRVAPTAMRPAPAPIRPMPIPLRAFPADVSFLRVGAGCGAGELAVGCCGVVGAGRGRSSAAKAGIADRSNAPTRMAAMCFLSIHCPCVIAMLAIQRRPSWPRPASCIHFAVVLGPPIHAWQTGPLGLYCFGWSHRTRGNGGAPASRALWLRRRLINV
jgi:hypothetical protein